MIKGLLNDLSNYLAEKVDTIRKSLPLFIVLFVILDSISISLTYRHIDNDCRVLGAFRVNDVAYSCEKLPKKAK